MAKLSLFTRTIVNRILHKAGNGYPACELHETRRIPKEELEKMEQCDYDHVGNNYEIYVKAGSTPRNGDFRKYFNWRGREVQRNKELYKKVGKGRNSKLEKVEGVPEWVEVHSHWSKEDINTYVDRLSDDIIKKTDYWYHFPVDELELPSLVQLILEGIKDLVKYNWKYYSGDSDAAKVGAYEMRIKWEALDKLILQTPEEHAGMVRIMLQDLDIDWRSPLSTWMWDNDLKKTFKEARYREDLRIKEVRWEYKKRLFAQKSSDNKPIYEHMGLRREVIFPDEA